METEILATYWEAKERSIKLGHRSVWLPKKKFKNSLKYEGNWANFPMKTISHGSWVATVKPWFRKFMAEGLSDIRKAPNPSRGLRMNSLIVAVDQ